MGQPQQNTTAHQLASLDILSPSSTDTFEIGCEICVTARVSFPTEKKRPTTASKLYNFPRYLRVEMADASSWIISAGRRYKHVGNAMLDDERESKATFSLRFSTGELQPGTYLIRCLLPKDYFETKEVAPGGEKYTDANEKEMIKKKKEIQRALLLASKKELQIHIAPTLEFVRSGAHDVKFRWNAKSLPPKVYESVLSSSSGSNSYDKGGENGNDSVSSSRMSGWKLALDVQPALRDNEKLSDVVSDAFVFAAKAGHSVWVVKGSRIMYEISTQELLEREKVISFPPSRSGYAVALAAFNLNNNNDENSEPAVTTRRVWVSTNGLEVSASCTKDAREVVVGDAKYAPKRGTSGSVIREQMENLDLQKPPAPGKNEASKFDRRQDWVPKRQNTDVGSSTASTSIASTWQKERGVNVLVFRLSDGAIEHDVSFDTIGSKRTDSNASRAACEALKLAFSPSDGAFAKSRDGQRILGARMVIVTTCGNWASNAAESGISDALREIFVHRFGGDVALASRAISDAIGGDPKNASAICMAAVCENSDEPNTFTSRFIDAPINKGKDQRASIKIRFAFTSPEGWFPMMRKLGNAGNDERISFSGIETAELLGATSSPVATQAATSGNQSNADDKNVQSWEVCGTWASEKEEEVSDDDDDDEDRMMEKVQNGEGKNNVEDDIDRILLELDADLNGEEEDDDEEEERAKIFEKPKSERGVVDISPRRREIERLESLKLRAIVEAIEPCLFAAAEDEERKTSKSVRASGEPEFVKIQPNFSVQSAQLGFGGEFSHSSVSATPLFRTLIQFVRRRMRRYQWDALKERESNDAASQVSMRMEHWMREISRKRESENSAKLACEFIAAGAFEYLRDRILHLIDIDGKLRVSSHQEDARTCIRTLAAFCSRDNGAHLAEAIRRNALDAILRSFLASWNGHLGADLDTTPLLKLERVVEWLAANDLKTCKVIIASTSSSSVSEKKFAETDSKSKHRRRTSSFAESTECFEMNCMRAQFPAMPDHDGIFAAPFRVIELEKPTHKKFDGLIQLPTKMRSATRNGAAPLSPLETKALSRLDSGWHGEVDPRIPTPRVKQTVAPIAEDFSDSESDWQDVAGEHLLSETNDADEDKMSAWYKDSVIAIKAKRNDWASFCEIIRQAPRLTWLLQNAGSKAVFFVWPKSTTKSGARELMQPLIANPNFETTELHIPVFVVPGDVFARSLEGAKAESRRRHQLFGEDCVIRIDIPALDLCDDGSTNQVARRLRNALLFALKDRETTNFDNHVVSKRTAPEGGVLVGRCYNPWNNPLSSSGDSRASSMDALSPTSSSASLFDPQSARKFRKWRVAQRIVNALGSEDLGIRAEAYDLDESEATPVRVLCMDGGGMRGYVTVVILKRILEATGAWCVGEVFDLIVGTSTGGIIALGAGLLRMTVAELDSLYEQMAKDVFKPDSYVSLLTKGPGHVAAKSFENVLRNVLGDDPDEEMFSVGAHQRWFRSAVPSPRVVLVSSLVSRNPSSLYMHRSYRRENHSPSTVIVDASTTSKMKKKSDLDYAGDYRIGMTAALRATTAAPWYMEELICEKELGYGSIEMSEKLSSASSSSLTSSTAATTIATTGTTSTSFAEHHKTSSSSSFGPGDILSDDVLNDEDLDADTEKAKAKAKRGELHGAGLNKLSPLESSRTQLRFIDGAISCNNPAAAAVFEAKRIFSPKRPLILCSVGTGYPVARDVPATYGASWVTNVVNATCDVVQVDATIRHVLDADKDEYFRFQPQGEIFSCALNDTSKETEKKLKQTALKYVNNPAQRKEIERLAMMLKKPRKKSSQ